MKFLRQYLIDGKDLFFFWTYNDYTANIKERKERLPLKWDTGRKAWKCDKSYLDSPLIQSFIRDFNIQPTIVAPSESQMRVANNWAKQEIERLQSPPPAAPPKPAPSKQSTTPKPTVVSPLAAIQKKKQQEIELNDFLIPEVHVPASRTSVGSYEQGIKDSYAVNTAYVPSIRFKDPNFTLYDYQRAGVEYATRRGQQSRCILADDMGIGKTCQGFAAIDVLNAYPLLVICPNNVMSNWYNELTTKLTTLRVGIYKDTPKQSDFRTVNIFILNYNYFGTKKAESFKKIQHNFRGLILDEAHSIKNLSGKWYKAIMPIAKSIPVVFAMTGTSYANKAIDLMPLIQLVNGEHLFGGTKELRSFLWNNPTKQHIKEIGRKLRGNYLLYGRSKLQEGMNMQLPSKTVLRHEVFIDNYEEYLKADEEFYSYLVENKRMSKWKAEMNVSMEMLTKLIHLINIASKGKINAAAKFVNEIISNDKKCIVFCKRKDTMYAISKILGKTAVTYSGDHSAKQKDEAIFKFKNDHDINAFVAILESAYQGINLQEASTVVFVDMDWRYSVNVQGEDRSWRTGQKNDVTVYYIVDNRTIDEVMWNVVQDKRRKHLAFSGMDDENKVEAPEITGKTNDAQELVMSFMNKRQLGGV